MEGGLGGEVWGGRGSFLEHELDGGHILSELNLAPSTLADTHLTKRANSSLTYGGNWVRHMGKMGGILTTASSGKSSLLSRIG